MRAALRVRYVHRIARIVVPKLPVLGVRVPRPGMRRIDRQLLVIGSDPVAVRVRVGEPPTEQHLVGARPGARHRTARLEGGLLDLAVVVGRVAIQLHGADVDQRVVGVRPHLGEIERIEPVGLGLLVRHDLHLQRPGGVVAAVDVLPQVPLVVVGVHGGHLVALVLREELDALVGLEVVFHPEPLALRVHPHVRVARIPVHVPPRAGDTAVTHQPCHLVCRLGRQRPEVPLHVVIAQIVVGPPLLGPDEVLELHGIADEEHRGVVAHHVEIALLGVELQGEAARVAPRVRAAPLTGDGGESREHLRLLAGLEQVRLGVGTHVVGDLESAERTGALGMWLAFRHALTVELGHLLDQVVVLEEDRPVGSDGQ